MREAAKAKVMSENEFSYEYEERGRKSAKFMEGAVEGKS